MTDDVKKKIGLGKRLLLWCGWFWATIISIGAGGNVVDYMTDNVFFLLFLIALSVPFIIRFGLKKKWKKRNLYASFLAVNFVIFMGAGFFIDKSTPVIRETTFNASSETPETKEKVSTVFQLNESFKVGYTRYMVKGIQWKRRLGTQYFGSTADARYLLVRVNVKNEDKENRSIPPFHLQDTNGATYDQSSDRMYLGDEAGIFDSLNPNVSKNMTLVFDVPPENHYRLVLSGGFWSSEKAQVVLN